jgi:hypothetical protein
VAFPASQQTLADGLASIKREAVNIKRYSEQVVAFSASNSSSANAVLEALGRLKSTIEAWDAAAAVPGIVQYARDQHDDQALDIVAEYTAMRAAAVTARDWIIGAFPKSGGFILKDTLTADGGITVRQFSSADLDPLRTHLNALIATIA